MFIFLCMQIVTWMFTLECAKMKCALVVGILTICGIARTTTVIYRTKKLTSTISGCDSRDCPPSKNINDVIRHCEYDIPVGMSYQCFERSSDSRVEFATPDLTCEPGFYGDPQVDENNPGYVIVEKKPCPTGYYQRTPSRCYNGCKFKHHSLQILDNYEQFEVDSKGDNISPARVYCNFKLGYYSRNGENFLDFDQNFEFVYEDFCANDPNHCTEGQVPLHNGSCVVPCNPGYERNVYDGFQCNKTMKTGLVPNNTHDLDVENGLSKTAASVGGAVGGVALFMVLAVLAFIIYRKRSKGDKQRKKKRYGIKSSFRRLLGQPFKKGQDDTLSQSMVDSLGIEMRTVGALIQNGKLMGTVFRVGPDYVMTAWHVVLPILDRLKTGRFIETNLQADSVFLTFNESLLNPPRRKYHIKEITWKSEDLDIVVLKISNPDTNLPGPVTLWKGSIGNLELSSVSFVGYGHPDSINMKHLDQRCKLLHSSSQRIMSAQAKLRKDVKKIKHVLTQHNRDTELADIGYYGYDQESKFLFDCYLEEGSSGSPALTNNNAMSVKVVGMLTHGFPKFYHDLKKCKSAVSWPDEYRFEMGVRMEYVYALMSEEKPDLAGELFNTTCSLYPQSQFTELAVHTPV